MRKLVFAFCLMVMLTVAARPADAHPPPFYWMSDISGTSSAGGELMIITSKILPDKVLLLGLDVRGNFALSPNITLTASLPLGFVAFDLPAPVDDDSGTALGNVNVGVLLHSPHERHEGTRFGGGVKLYLPTASDSDIEGVAAAMLAAHYVPNWARYLPNTTTVRVQGDLRFTADPIFLQVEGALDLHFVQDADDLTMLVFGLGFGAMLSPKLALLGELTFLSDILEDSDGENFVETLDLGLRYHNPTLMFGARLYLPLDNDFRDADVIGFGLDLAARF